MPADRSKILAWQIEKSLKCGECNIRRDEWEDDRDAYYVEDVRCIGCEKIAWANHSWAEERTSAYGIKFRLVKPNTQPEIKISDGKRHW